MPDVTPSGRDVLERLAIGLGPGVGRANALLKLERDGLIYLRREEPPRKWDLTLAGREWLAAQEWMTLRKLLEDRVDAVLDAPIGRPATGTGILVQASFTLAGLAEFSVRLPEADY